MPSFLYLAADGEFTAGALDLPWTSNKKDAAKRNFAVGSMFSFVLGIGLYGLTYL